jgi:uncharacterized protein (DUF362 family)
MFTKNIVASSKVVITKATYTYLSQKLESSLSLIGMPNIRKDDEIAIKINLCDARTPDTGAITHPIFLDSLLRCIRENAGNSVKINVVESEATVSAPDLFIRWFGFLPVLKRWNANYVNLSKDEKVVTKISGRALDHIDVPATVSRSNYFISLAKLKTNGLTKITCALKNQFGCLPAKRKTKYHDLIDDVIVDANLAMRPHLSIVDGIIAHVGIKGPAFGRPVPSNLFIVGKDPVSVDAVCSKVLGFSPHFVGHIKKAAEANIGVMRNYELVLDGFSEMPRINSEFSVLEKALTELAVGIFKKS